MATVRAPSPASLNHSETMHHHPASAPRAAPSARVGWTGAKVVAKKGERGSTAMATTGEHIAQLQQNLSELGYQPGGADGKLGPSTKSALKQFARDEGLPEKDAVRVTPELLGAVNEARSRQASFQEAVMGLTQELRAKNPQLLEAIRKESIKIRRLESTSQRELATKAAYGRLELALDRAVTSGSLSPKAAQQWRTFRDQAHKALKQGSLLQWARVSDSAFRAERRAEFATFVSRLTRELHEKEPQLAEQLLAEIARIPTLTDEKVKIAEITAGYQKLDKRINTLAGTLDPLTMQMWQEYRGQFDELARDGRLVPTARLAAETYTHETLALLEAERKRLGERPDTVKVSQKLAAAIAALEKKALAAGSKDVSYQMLMKMVPTLTKERAIEIVPFINQAMNEGNIDTPLQKCAFIAQIAHETANFRTFKEYGGPAYFTKMYEPVFERPVPSNLAPRAKRAKSLGNTQPGDGARFAGRGAIQLTGRENYTRASQNLFGDARLVERPEMAEQPEMAFRTAVWFWNKNYLNRPAAAGNFKHVVQTVNGGTNGWSDRLAIYTRGLHEFGV